MKRPMRIGFGITLGIFIWNFLVLLLALWLKKDALYLDNGFPLAFYGGLPWSWALLVFFSWHGAMVANQVFLFIGLLINGYLLGLILKWIWKTNAKV